MAENTRLAYVQELTELKKLLKQKESKEKELSQIQELIASPKDKNGVLNKSIYDFANETYKEIKNEIDGLERDLRRLESSPIRAVKRSEDFTYGIGFLIGCIVTVICYIAFLNAFNWAFLGNALVSGGIGFVVWIASALIIEFVSNKKYSAAVNDKAQQVQKKKDEIKEVEKKLNPHRKTAQKELDKYIANETQKLKQEVQEQYSTQLKELPQEILALDAKIKEHTIIQPKDFEKIGSLIHALENHYAETIPEAFRWIHDQEKEEEEKKRRAQEELRIATQRMLEAEARKPGTAHITLADSSGRTPMHNSVYVDGMPYGSAPCNVSLTPGTHTAYVCMTLYYGGRDNFHQSSSYEFTIRPNMTTDVKFKFDTPSRIYCISF